MFGPPGRLYVYLIYGMHHCANFVTGADGDGQAVLIRGVTIEGVAHRLTSGPGRLCRVLGIDKAMDGTVLDVSAPLRPPPEVVPTPRIGITKGIDLLRRWHVH